MPRLDDETLQRLFDEELEAAEAGAVEQELAASPRAQQAVHALGQLRDLVRAEVDQASDRADLHALWPRIHARVAAEPHRPAGRSWLDWLGLSMGTHPLRWLAAGAVTAVLAVGLTFLVAGRPRPPKVEPTSAPLVRRVDIEGLEFQGRHPDIFQIQGAQGETTVIWVYPEDEEEDRGPASRPPADGPEDI